MISHQFKLNANKIRQLTHYLKSNPMFIKISLKRQFDKYEDVEPTYFVKINFNSINHTINKMNLRQIKELVV